MFSLEIIHYSRTLMEPRISRVDPKLCQQAASALYEVWDFEPNFQALSGHYNIVNGEHDAQAQKSFTRVLRYEKLHAFGQDHPWWSKIIAALHIPENLEVIDAHFLLQGIAALGATSFGPHRDTHGADYYTPPVRFSRTYVVYLSGIDFPNGFQLGDGPIVMYEKSGFCISFPSESLHQSIPGRVETQNHMGEALKCSIFCRQILNTY